MILLLLSVLNAFGIFASLGEAPFIIIGTAVFVLGQIRGSASAELDTV